MRSLAILVAGFLASAVLAGQEAAADPVPPGGLPPLPAALAVEETARVTAVVDGDTVVLEDGRQVRLVGIQAPKLPLGRPGFTAWPGAEAARRHLAGLVAGHTVGLARAADGNPRDRHGRTLAHLVAPGGVWVQGTLLAAGQARVYTFPDNRAAAAEMLSLEARARAGRRGIWADPFYAVRTPGTAADHLDTFQLVEGRVIDAARVNGRVYLNFGADWRDDFTATIAPEDRDAFDTAPFDPLDLAGQRVRVRGWLYWYNGPALDLTHPEQLERLADPGP